MFKMIITVCLFLMGVQYGSSQDSCAILKEQRIVIDSKILNIPQFYRLRVCGFDSLDCEISVALTSALLNQRQQSGGNSELFFRDVIQVLEQFRSRQDYLTIREAEISKKKESSQLPEKRPFYDSTLLCSTPKYLDIFDSFGNTPQYFDYEQALACSRLKCMPLFVYFTAFFSANSRRMEKILADADVREFLLSHFVLVTLYVDGDFSGKKKNFDLQQKFGSNSQPYFYVIDNKGHIQFSVGGYQSKEDLLSKLKESLRP